MHLEFTTGFKDVPAWEVVLGPGQVLYVPPLYVHYVAAVSNATHPSSSSSSTTTSSSTSSISTAESGRMPTEFPSISVSTHTEAHVAQARQRAMQRAERDWDALAATNQTRWDRNSLRARALFLWLNGLYAPPKESPSKSSSSEQQKTEVEKEKEIGEKFKEGHLAAVAAIKELLASRWDYLHLDK